MSAEQGQVIMSQPLYIKITGKTQKEFHTGAFSEASVGSVAQGSHENEIFCQAFSYEIFVPRDPQSGAPTAKRVHQPAIFTKYVDKASPMIMQAIATGESLTIEANYYRTTTAGEQEQYYTATFSECTLVRLHTYTPMALDPANGPFRDMEEVHFTYAEINLEHKPGGTSAVDNWKK